MCTDIALSNLFKEVEPSQPTQTVPFNYVKKTPLDGKSLYTSKQRITFTFENEGFLDPESVVLFINVNFPNGTASGRNIALSQGGIIAVFSRMTLRYGSLVLEDIYEPSVINKILLMEEFGNDMYSSAVGYATGTMYEAGLGALQGVFDRSSFHNKANLPASTGSGEMPRRYMVKFRFGLFNQKKWLPLQNMSNQISIDLEVNEATKCTYFAQPGGSVAYTNQPILNIALPELVYKVNFVKNEELDLINQALQVTPFECKFNSYHYFRNSLPPTQARHQISIPIFEKRIKRIFACLRAETDLNLNSQDANNFYTSLDPRLGDPPINPVPPNIPTLPPTYNGLRETTLRSYQWSYNNDRIPTIPIIVNEEASNVVTASDVALNRTSTAVESIYYYNEYLRENSSTALPRFFTPGFDNGWSTMSSGEAINSVFRYPVTTKTTIPINVVQFPGSQDRTAPCGFVMIGNFSGVDLTGNEWCLSGDSCNPDVKLHLEFQNGFSTSITGFGGTSAITTAPSPYVDVFVQYESILRIDANNNVTLDS